METYERQTEFFETPKPFNIPTKLMLQGIDEKKASIKAKVRWTQSITFHIVMNNPEFHSLQNRDMLIKKVKQYAHDIMGVNPDTVKAETITRTWRKMVEDGFIKKDFASDIAEEAHREHWGE